MQIAKPKYNRGGRLFRRRQWVFGGVCSLTGDGFLIPVPNRKASTLLPLIVNNIAAGSIIMSDEWRAYSRITRLPVRPRYSHEGQNYNFALIKSHNL